MHYITITCDTCVTIIILYQIFLIISLFAKIYVREIFEISQFAKINVREIHFFWSRENYCSRKLMTLRYLLISFHTYCFKVPARCYNYHQSTLDLKKMFCCLLSYLCHIFDRCSLFCKKKRGKKVICFSYT